MPTIYSLEHPITGEVKYIGVTRSPLNIRLNGHLNSKNKTKVNNWCLDLVNENMLPVIKEVDIVEQTESNNIEEFWIHQFKSWGFELLNNNKIIRVKAKYSDYKHRYHYYSRNQFVKTIKLSPELLDQLNKERLKIKPSPSLHAYMLFKLSRPLIG